MRLRYLIFNHVTFYRCKILDKHMSALAPKHIETKFCKINALKCPFLTDRLKIKVIPTMAVIKDGITKDYIVGKTKFHSIEIAAHIFLKLHVISAAY